MPVEFIREYRHLSNQLQHNVMDAVLGKKGECFGKPELEPVTRLWRVRIDLVKDTASKLYLEDDLIPN